MRTYIIAACLLITGSAQAETIQQALQVCGQEQNSLKRLVCYDGIVQNMSRYSEMEALMAVPAPLSSNGQLREPTKRNSKNTESAYQSVPSATVTSPDERFGIEHRASTESAKEKIFATVTSIDKDAYNKIRVTLSNGHVWKQTDSQRMSLNKGDEVYVERGVLGAFYLSKEESNRRARVKRIQ
ncbi:hypothetical protein OE749_07745 [Aestuariibacter sp. AA17]|uniref:Uncharacterized protein n=1 Tax=Fluctibacter corallii TaxID=2984329 RepID=A0ABT3A7F8_9ALTE|nr:hypothetical protein [Aestuariibacter sp. AA17]MCV2884584.1 hypothetical protein [Aestuariibacter sp. AA17]